jgi:hypothetical protein
VWAQLHAFLNCASDGRDQGDKCVPLSEIEPAAGDCLLTELSHVNVNSRTQ